MGLTVGALCAGYGGLEMGLARVLDIRVSWFAEYDKDASTVLAHHWPGVPNHGDITSINWDQVTPVDIVCAGFPCQDISNAGPRIGIEGTRSGIWANIARGIRVLRPRVVFVENVAALNRRGIDVVLRDLATAGFDAEWMCTRASEVGAPHRRERMFILATANTEPGRWDRGTGNLAETRRRDESAHRGHALTDTGVQGLETGTVQHHGSQRTTVERSGSEPTSVERFGDYAPAITRWERMSGRPAPCPTEPGRTGERLAPRFVEWMMGLPAGHVTDAPGLSRNAQLRILGNGVVPAQAANAFELLSLMAKEGVA